MSPLGQSRIVPEPTGGRTFGDNFYPVCSPFLPNPKMKGQKLALTLAAWMATSAFSAASPGVKPMRA